MEGSFRNFTQLYDLIFLSWNPRMVGLEGKLKIISLHRPSMGQDTFHSPKLFQALALDISRDSRAATASLNNLCQILTTLTRKNFSLISILVLKLWVVTVPHPSAGRVRTEFKENQQTASFQFSSIYPCPISFSRTSPTFQEPHLREINVKSLFLIHTII